MRIVLFALIFVCLACASYGHTVSGIVTDAQANPVANASVWLNQDRAPRKTDAAPDGTFSFDGVDTGLVEIVAWKEGLACGGMDARVAGDASVGIVLREPATVSLQLLERRLDPRTGAPEPPRPIAGARVLSLFVNNEFHASVEDLAPLGFPNPRSDDTGKLNLAFLPKGGYASFTVTHREYADQHIPYYPVDHKELTLQMLRGIVLRGRATNNHKLGVPRARVSISKVGPPPLRKYKEALSDSDGFYDAILEPGDYFVVAKHREYASSEPVRVSVRIDQDEAVCDVALATAHRISGRVASKDDRPVAGVNVHYVKEGVIYDSALTSVDGSFELRASAGDGKIHVDAPDGYIAEQGTDVGVTVTDADVAIGSPLRITELPVITGTIVDEAGAPQANVIVSSTNLEPQEWTVTADDGSFALRLLRAPHDGQAQFRAEHPRRFTRADFSLALSDPAPQRIQLIEFTPDTSPCDPNAVRNELELFRDKPAPPIDCKEWFNVADAKTPVTIASLAGKVIVLVFWGGFDTTEQSLTRIRMMNTLHEVFRETDDVAVVGICDSISESDEVRAFLQTNSVQYPVGIDNETASFDLYDIFSIPQVVVLDKKGVFRYYDVEGRLLELIKSLRREAG
ncbi:MAG: carboxypeptidase regulatory-like domain-containing protein [Candidatus Hydrogenedentes bacterium]|nr:carboxypeptidase regulatory-like domain-containing protein [Candidatus Hydrogenedentota bacterium]